MPRTIVVADPPWNYKVWSKKGAGRSAESHYNTMSNQALMDLKPLINTAFGDDSIMCMWATKPTLPFGIKLLEHWGYEYKTIAFTWIKLNQSFVDRFIDIATSGQNIPFTESDLLLSLGNLCSVGMGHYTRSNAEFVILGKRGKTPLQRMRRNVREIVLSPILEHSEKPDEVNKRIELLLRRPQDKMYELFARRQYSDWWCTGNELDGLDIRRALTMTNKSLKERVEQHQLDLKWSANMLASETELAADRIIY